MKSRVLIAAVFTCLTTLAHAGTLTVGQSGSGAGFTSLEAAVIAAQPGDVILVADGVYVSAGPILVNKSLTIIGAGSSITQIHAGQNSPSGDVSALQVKNLAASDEVRIFGMDVRNPINPFAYSSTAVVIENCAGFVALADVVGTTGNGPGFTAATAMVSNSNQVFLDNCKFVAPHGNIADFTPGTYKIMQSGLRADGSHVTINDCEIRGADSGFAESFSSHGGIGIEAVGSTIHVARSSVFGGIGANWTPAISDPLAVGNGGPGISGISSSSIFLYGGSSRGGDSGSHVATSAGFGGAAVFASADSTVQTTPNANLVSGADNIGPSTTPPVDTLGVHVALAEALAELDLHHSVRSPGGLTFLSMRGTPNGAFLPYFSVGQTPSSTLPGIAGNLILNLNQIEGLPATFLSATGQATLFLNIPATPSLSGISVIFQGLALSQSAQLSISLPALLAIH